VRDFYEGTAPREGAMHQRADWPIDWIASGRGKRPEASFWDDEMVDGPPAAFLVKGLKKAKGPNWPVGG